MMVSNKTSFAPIFPLSTTRIDSQPLRNASVKSRNVLRDQFQTSTWLLLGALAQISLSLLPIRKVYAALPTVVVLLWRVIDYVLILRGWKANPYMEGVIPGHVTAKYPGGVGASEPQEDKVSIVLLGARSNHPNGIFTKDFKHINALNIQMTIDLEENSDTNGYLGCTSWLNSADRGTSPELLNIFYFRSKEDVHEFAHGPAHREGWAFWNKLVKENKAAHYSLSHELYEAPRGLWENLYLNSSPTGMGITQHPVRDEAGVQRWAKPLLDAERGKYRTSRGRLGLADGTDNDKYQYEDEKC